jgi:hypothetical protein
VGCASAVGEAAGEGLAAVAAGAGLPATPGAGLSVTGTDAPGAAGCPCGTFVAGDSAGAIAGAGACAPGLVPGAPGGDCAGGGDCAIDVSASVSEQTEAMNDVFIVLLSQEFDGTIAVFS